MSVAPVTYERTHCLCPHCGQTVVSGSAHTCTPTTENDMSTETPELQHTPTPVRRRLVIRKSATADTRTCDFANVTETQLLLSSVQHIADVRRALAWFGEMLDEAATQHDEDKLTNISGFHRDFITGFEQQGWLARHQKLNRHHLLADDGVPEDVNLIDVLEMIADCVMAGMARSGSVYPLDIKLYVLMRAFQNTAALLQAHVKVRDD